MAKKSGKKSGSKKGKLVTPKGNTGKLWAGPAPGRAPATGRPPNELRAKMRGQLGTVLEEIDELMAKRDPCEECGRRFTDNDMVRLGDFLAKYGIGTAKAGIDETLMRALAADVQAEVGEDEETLRRIRDRWVMTLGAHATGRG